MNELQPTEPRPEPLLTDEAELQLAAFGTMCICVCLLGATLAGAQNASIASTPPSPELWRIDAPAAAPEELAPMPTPDPNAAFDSWTFVSTPAHEAALAHAADSFDLAELEAMQARRTARLSRPKPRVHQVNCLCFIAGDR